jgi:ppGpp synthetase/RelA/SpoT-type nucleotidyltranferase
VTLDAFPEIAEAHSKAQPTLRLVERSLAGFLKLVCDEMSLERHNNKWARIVDESRVKDAQGLKRALEEAGKTVASMWEIDDLVGARAVVLRLSDADALATRIMSHRALRLQGTHVTQIHNEETGYRAIHIKGWLKVDGTRVGCEIQIRTELQDAWAVASRSDLHKKQKFPPAVIEAAKLEADHLAVIDQAFEWIRTLISDYDISPTAKAKAEAEMEPDVLEP